jgi:hypothetical protein
MICKGKLGKTMFSNVNEPNHNAKYSLLQPLEEINPVSFYGRCAGLVLLAVWSWYLIGYDYRIAEINLSFMHDILLPIHEAGHVLFRPFGEFMTILGGSLFQVMAPLGIGVAFIWKNSDNFGGAMGFWLGGASLVDVSPYVYDALHPYMTLLGGHTGADGPRDGPVAQGAGMGCVRSCVRRIADGRGAGVGSGGTLAADEDFSAVNDRYRAVTLF